MKEMIPLHQLPSNAVARVEGIGLTGAIGQRIQDLGLVEGTKITCVHESPRKNPRAYLIRGAVIALRNQDAQGISVRLAGGI